MHCLRISLAGVMKKFGITGPSYERDQLFNVVTKDKATHAIIDSLFFSAHLHGPSTGREFCER